MLGNSTSSSTANTSSNSSSANIFDCSFSSASSISFEDEQEFPKKTSSNTTATTTIGSSSASNSTPFFMLSSSTVPGGYKISKKSSNSSLFSNNSSSSSISSTASNNVNNMSSTSLPFNNANTGNNNNNNSHSRSSSIHKNPNTKKNRSNSFFLSPSLTCKLQNSISSITHHNSSSSNNNNTVSNFDYSDIDDIDSSSAVNDNFFDTPSSSSSKISINTAASILFNNNKDYDDIDSLLSNTDDHNEINDDLSSPLQKRNKSARRTQSMFLNKQLSSTLSSDTTTTSVKNSSNPSPSCRTLRTSASMIYSSDYSILENKNDLLTKANLPFFHIKEDSVPRITSSTMHDILKGKYANKFPDLKIIDCRFDYEFIGGHVQGAININSQQRLHEYFFNEKNLQINNDNIADSLIVFHCEFSQFRGPKMAETLRRFDRQINKENYPNLHYPNLVVLSGGYCDFFKQSPQQCIPRNYITMNDERYTLKCSVEMERFQSCLKKKTSTNQLYCSSTSSLSSTSKRSPGFLNSHLRTSSFNSNNFFSSNINSGSSVSTNITANSDWIAVSKKRSSSSLRSHKRHNTVNSAFFPALKTNNSFCTSSGSFSTTSTNEDSDTSDDFMVPERPQRTFCPRLTRKSAMLSLSSTIMINNTNFREVKIRENQDDDVDEDYDDDDDLDDFGVINDNNLIIRNDHHARRPSISMIPDDEEDTGNITVFNLDSSDASKGNIFGMKMANSITVVNSGNNNPNCGITASSSTSTIIGDEELSSSICNNKHQEHSNSYVNLQNADENNEDDDIIQYRYSGEERDSPVSNIFGIY